MDESHIWNACADGHLDLVKEYLNDGGDVNIKNEYGWNLIIIAAFHHQYEIVELLLENGSDVNSINNKGTSVLMYAKTKVLINRSFWFLQYLINNGAKVNLRDKKNGFTVLDYVKLSGDAEMIVFFLKNGAI